MKKIMLLFLSGFLLSQVTFSQVTPTDDFLKYYIVTANGTDVTGLTTKVAGDWAQNGYYMGATHAASDRPDDEIIVSRLDDIGDQVWAREINISGNDNITGMFRTADDGVVVSGTFFNGQYSWVAKFGPTGLIQWSRLLWAQNTIVHVEKVVETTSGFLAMGYVNSNGYVSGLLQGFDNAGVPTLTRLVWSTPGTETVITDAVRGPNATWLFTGHLHINPTCSHLILGQIDPSSFAVSNLNSFNLHQVGGPASACDSKLQDFTIVEANGGGYAIHGFTTTNSFQPYDHVLVKLDATASITSASFYDTQALGYDDGPEDITRHGPNGYVITGTARNPNNNANNGLIGWADNNLNWSFAKTLNYNITPQEAVSHFNTGPVSLLGTIVAPISTITKGLMFYNTTAVASLGNCDEVQTQLTVETREWAPAFLNSATTPFLNIPTYYPQQRTILLQAKYLCAPFLPRLATEDMDEANAEGDFKVYPVPAHDRLNLDLPTGLSEIQVQLHNNLGQLVMTRRLSTESTSAQLSIDSNWPRGIYYLRVEAQRDGSLINWQQPVIIE